MSKPVVEAKPAASPASMVTAEHMRAMLYPKGVAVVGATERAGSVGSALMKNLMTNKGSFEIYPVNPTRSEVYGIKSYPKVSEIVGEPELVIVITPAHRCADVMRDCVKQSAVKCVVVIAAGFKEVGEEGLRMELELVEIAASNNIAVVGPNCLGVQSPNWGMNASFAAHDAAPGNVAFLSQSGAMCVAVLDWARCANIGFSAFISIGSMAHANWAHMLEFLGNDEKTESIIIYMETIGDAEHFIKVAKKITKPIAVIKAGRTEQAAAAAVSHTGSLAGSHDSFIAAMRRVGITVVESIQELTNLTLLFSLQPAPSNNAIYVVTNAGGPGVLSTDASVISGLDICDLEPELKSELDSFLPPAWSHSNPIDVLGDAKDDAYRKSVDAVMRRGRPGSSLLVVLTAQGPTPVMETAQAVIDVVAKNRADPTCKFTGPVVCSWLGGEQVLPGAELLNKSGIPCIPTPDGAAGDIGRWYRSITRKVNPVPEHPSPKSKQLALEIVENAIKERREILTEHESKGVLKAYGIPVAESIVCADAASAVKAAEGKYPVVVKLNSEFITHKSDVGGVKLNIKDAAGVEAAFAQIQENVNKINPAHFQGVSVQPMLDIASGVELLMGSTPDVQFGPVVVFGTGGTFVEVFRDTTLSIPPIEKHEAEAMVSRTKISKALEPGHGDRFKGCPKDQLYDIMSKFSWLVCDLAGVVSECEINPLLALKDQVVALDARVVLKAADAPPLAAPCLI